MSDTKQLKKQMKVLSKKELIQLIIAIDSVSQEQLNGHKKTIKKQAEEIKEYRDALGIIYDRSLNALEPTYEIDETYTCEIPEECYSKCPETCNSEVCYCADDHLHGDMPKAERTNIDLDGIERPSGIKLDNNFGDLVSILLTEYGDTMSEKYKKAFKELEYILQEEINSK